MRPRPDDELPPDLRAIQEVVRELPPVPAPAEFERGLRAAFARGQIRSPFGPEPRPRPQDELAAPRVGALRRRFVRPHILIPAAAAAALILALIWMGPEVEAQWRLAGVAGSGSVLVDGEPASRDELARDERLLRAGRRIALAGDAQIDLVLGDLLVLQGAPGAEFEIPRFSRSRSGVTIEGAVAQSEVRFMTGAAFVGSRLVISGTASVAEVTGTTFAVICAPDTTCICVFEGSVRMLDADGGSGVVAAGTRRIAYRNAALAPVVEPISAMESMKLSMMKDAATEILRQKP